MTRRTFREKSVVVTGAAGGLGSAFSRRFGLAGSNLTLLDLNSEKLRSLEKDLMSNGIQCITKVCDVTKEDDCNTGIDAAIANFGGIDVLINNAGITHRSSFSKTEMAVYRKVMDVNFFGSLYCTKAAMESLIQREGLIVIISTIAGFSPLYGRTGYAASKHALHGMFDSLRAELRGTGVSVLIVCPGFTSTGISRAALDGDGTVTEHPQSTVGKAAMPGEVAEKVFRAAVRDKRLIVLSSAGKTARFVNKFWPSIYDRLMVRSLRSELER